MKLAPILLLLILTSCAPREWVEYKFEVENINELSALEKETTNKLLQDKLNRFGFSESKLYTENQFLIVETIINPQSENEVNNFKSIFESNKLELWDTYQVTDQVIIEIDTSLLREKYFTPYFDLDLGYNRKEVLGKCTDKSKLDEILRSLSSKTNHIENLNLLWSKEEIDFESGSSYNLYMINNRGRKETRLSEQNIENIKVYEDQYHSDSYAISFRFVNRSKMDWAQMTKRAAANGNRCVAVVVNDRVQSIPFVRAPILEGNSSLDGAFTKEEAEKLARSIDIGRLDYKLKLISENVMELEVQD